MKVTVKTRRPIDDGVDIYVYEAEGELTWGFDSGVLNISNGAVIASHPQNLVVRVHSGEEEPIAK